MFTGPPGKPNFKYICVCVHTHTHTHTHTHIHTHTHTHTYTHIHTNTYTYTHTYTHTHTYTYTHTYAHTHTHTHTYTYTHTHTPIYILCLVTQSCLTTLGNPKDCSLPGFSVYWDSPGKNTGVGCYALLQGIFPTQGSNPVILYFRQIIYQLSYQGSIYIYICVCVCVCIHITYIYIYMLQVGMKIGGEIPTASEMQVIPL